MKDILFRGKSQGRNSEWVYGWYAPISVSDSHGPQMVIVTVEPNEYAYMGYGGCIASPKFYTVEPNTVGRFTGLLDKHGRKIFEGDVVRAMMHYGPAGSIESVAVIDFKKYDGYRWQYFDVKTIEVIGNIYDNPDFLEAAYQ